MDGVGIKTGRVSVGWSALVASVAVLAIMLVVIAGPSGNQPLATNRAIPTTTNAGAPLPNFDYIYLIVMENEEARSIVGNPDAPYLNQLMQQYGLAMNYTAIAHPSQPNYLALWSGSPQGVRDNGVHRLNAVHIGDQLEAAGKSWQVFAQNLPLTDAAGQPTCFTGATASGGPDGAGNYARKHEPAVSFLNVSNDTARCVAHITDFRHFDPAAANLELIVPNLCNDMHDCPITTGDAWLKSWLGPHILDTPTWRDSNSALFITWDEGSSNDDGGGNVATLVISKQTPPGFTSNMPHDHYSLLRSIQDVWGLGCLQISCMANNLSEFFR
jgi:phosphatidylinositol-3-phosphatase